MGTQSRSGSPGIGLRRLEEGEQVWEATTGDSSSRQEAEARSIRIPQEDIALFAPSHESHPNTASAKLPTQQTSHTPRTELKPDLADRERWTRSNPYVHIKAPEGDPWTTLSKGVRKYDEEMCKGWKEDLETLLVFTGLFSAVVTAFCIESVKTLSADPMEINTAILLAISRQIANPSFPSAKQADHSAFSPSRFAVQINVLYFISLTLALSVASVCILGKQWIREFQKDIPGSSRGEVRVRQARFDSLQKWRVPHILAALPVILQAALLLFFGGLLSQLWGLSDITVAIVISIIVGTTSLLIVVTTIVPAHWSGGSLRTSFTPFRSPQAWLYFALYQRIRQLLGFSRDRIIRSWVEFDTKFLSCEKYSPGDRQSEITTVHRALCWVMQEFENHQAMEEGVLWCLLPSNLPSVMFDEEGQDFLLNYVSSGVDISPARMKISRRKPLRRLPVTVIGRSTSQLGRAELLIRNANGLITVFRAHFFWSEAGHDPEYVKEWMVAMGRICRQLMQLNELFYRSSNADVQRRSDTNVLHEQIAFMVHDWVALLTMRNPRLGFELLQQQWEDCMRLLLRLNASTTSPAALQILRDMPQMLNDSWPGLSDTAPILCRLGQGVIQAISEEATPLERAERTSDLSFGAFTALDSLMVRVCTSAWDDRKVSRECINLWQHLRAKAVKFHNEPPVWRTNMYAGKWDLEHGKWVQLHAGERKLPNRYFNELHPCAQLDAVVTSQET